MSKACLSVSGFYISTDVANALKGVERQNLPVHHVGWHKDDLLREFPQSHQSGSQLLLVQRQPNESRRGPSNCTEPFMSFNMIECMNLAEHIYIIILKKKKKTFYIDLGFLITDSVTLAPPRIILKF